LNNPPKTMPNREKEGVKLMNPQERHLADPLSRAKAVHAKCWDCCVFQREEIRRCPMTDCALWDFRPYK
jgi:hypothetical protein